MTVKPKLGGVVQIGRKHYDVMQAPVKAHDAYVIVVRSQDNLRSYWAKSPDFRQGCGPWQLDGFVDDQSGGRNA